MYNLTAVGTNAAGAVNSLPVAIDVERQYVPVGIAAGPTTLYLGSIGDRFPLQVIGSFSDGSTLDVSHSTQMTYTSNNTQVVTVDTSGMVTAVGPGQTTILVRAGVVLGYSYDAIMVQVPQQPSSAPAPVITSVAPTSGVPGSTQVTITGSGFGATQGSGFLQLGTQNGVVSSWSDTQIVATVAAWAASGIASVNQNSLYSNNVPFTISAPVIQGILPASVIPGTQVTITGAGFGANQGSGYVTTANKTPTVVSWSDTQIVVSIVTGTTPGQLYVRQGGINSQPVNFTITAPTLTAISPTSVTPGTQMTLTGSGFGATQGSGGVYFGSGHYGSTVSWSDSQVISTVPTGITPGVVLVYQYGVNGSSLAFTTIAPTLTSISPTSVTPGVQMTLAGSGFGATQGSGSVYFGSGRYGSIVSWSDTQIVATVPTGIIPGNVLVNQYGDGHRGF